MQQVHSVSISTKDKETDHLAMYHQPRIHIQTQTLALVILLAFMHSFIL